MPINIFGVTILGTRNYNLLKDLPKAYSLIKKLYDKSSQDLNEKTNERFQAQKDLERSNELKDLAIINMQEAYALAESYLGDKKTAEEQQKELSRLLREAIKNGKRLSKIENLVINEEIIPLICCTPYGNKITYAGDHVSPRGGEKFAEKVAKCPYVFKVTKVGVIKNIRKDRLKKSGKNDHTLEAIFTDKTRGARIEILTTAKTEIQQEFIYRILKRELRIKS